MFGADRYLEEMRERHYEDRNVINLFFTTLNQLDLWKYNEDTVTTGDTNENERLSN